MKPSDIIEVYETGSRVARRTGSTFQLDPKKLRALGFTKKLIDAIYLEIERFERDDKRRKSRLAKLDALFGKDVT